MSDMEILISDKDAVASTPQQQPLHHSVKQSVQSYLAHLDGHKPSNLYYLVLEQIEPPLIEAILQYTRGNQSKAAQMLGISRGTLRKKIKQYGIVT